MDFVDSAGTRYQLSEETEPPAPTKKTPVWPWVVGGLALAGGVVWMASASASKPNPIDPETEAMLAEARNSETPMARLLELSKHPKAEIRRALLDNPNVCPTKVDGKLYTLLLEELAKEFPEEVANLPVFVLHALIEHTDEMLWVVNVVVERTKDVGLIERLWPHWGTSWGLVREPMAKNPSTPVDILRLLGNETTEEELWVRQAVAKNSNSPVDVLRTLGNPKTESYWSVREAVASNPNTPDDLLRTLANKKTESKWTVRKAAKEALARRRLA